MKYWKQLWDEVTRPGLVEPVKKWRDQCLVTILYKGLVPTVKHLRSSVVSISNMATVNEVRPADMRRVLLVEDDMEFCELLQEYLGSNHYDVETVNDGERGLERARSGEHDIVILDIMLPGISGFEVLRQIRQGLELPILILTAKGEEIDRVVGLELGADDYVTKPVSPRELVARMRTILRRTHRPKISSQAMPGKGPIRVGDVVLDPGARRVTCLDRSVKLTSVEFDILETLLRSAGRVVSREQLCKGALDRELSSMDRAVDMHVSRLRKKLGKGTEDEERIKTIRGVGYLYARNGDEGRALLQPETLPAN